MIVSTNPDLLFFGALLTLRRPNFSMVKTDIQEAIKYSVPLQAAMSLAKNGLKPTPSSSTTGR